MKNRKKILLTAVLTSFLLTGCADPVKDGMKALEAGDYKEAAAQFQEAAGSEDKKEAAEGYRGLGFALYEEGDYKEALDAFQNALDAGAQQTVEIYNLMGVSAMQTQDYKTALEAVQSGLALADSASEESADPELIREMRYNEIICCEQTADWESAKQKMTEYISDYPDDEQASREADFLQTR